MRFKWVHRTCGQAKYPIENLDERAVGKTAFNDSLWYNIYEVVF